MIKTIKTAWSIPELRKKILFTIFCLLIFRLGSAVPVPFINTEYLQQYLATRSGTILSLMNAMSGSAFSEATVFALSVQPYINSSIIIQLLTVAIPPLERMARDQGEEGRKKIAAITRYVTVLIGLLQGFGYYTLISSANGYNLVEVPDGIPTVWSAIVIILAFTAGSAFLMWLGEQITEFGIGNGISIILFASIISRLPNLASYLVEGVQRWAAGETASTSDSISQVVLHPAAAILLVIGILAIITFITFINGAERRIPVQYAKRVVGRKMYGGQSSHLPMKVNMSGVMPIIFAQSITMLPATIGAFVPSSSTEGSGWNTFLKVFDSTTPLYMVVYFLLIIAFSYFYATMQFNPIEVANNLKKQGGFIPGIRPGRPTTEFLMRILNRITLFGAIYLGIVAIAPIIASDAIGVSSLSIGGTSVIIVVGVALETVKALEAQMLMRHYKGFLD